MRVPLRIGLALAFACSTPSTFGAEKLETPHLAFVNEYVRELAAVERIRAAGEQQQKQGTKDDTFSNLIYTSTRIQLELRAQIATLKGMRLNPPYEQLPVDLAAYHTQKIAVHQTLIDISTAFISSSPNPASTMTS